MVPLVALALSAAGTGTQMAASEAERKKMEDKARAELSRQKGFQRQSQVELQKSIAQSGPDVARKQMDTGKQTLMDQYSKLADLPLAASSAAESIPVSQSTRGAAESTNQAAQQAQANLGSMDEWTLQQSIKNLRAQQQLGLVSSFARGSQGVLPYELQSAQHSAEGLRAAGMGMSLAGSLAGLYGSLGTLAAPAATTAAQPAAQATASTAQTIPGWGLYGPMLGSMASFYGAGRRQSGYSPYASAPSYY
jgi:hypothetical protein